MQPILTNTKALASGGSVIWRATLVILLAVCTLVVACHNVATTWSAEARSPDGHWVAIARSRQWGGPGAAYDATTVYLQRVRAKQHAIVDFLSPGPFRPIEILAFSHQYARMSLKMNWMTPIHLEVVYGPSGRPGDHVAVDFQAVKCAGIDISLGKISGKVRGGTVTSEGVLPSPASARLGADSRFGTPVADSARGDALPGAGWHRLVASARQGET